MYINIGHRLFYRLRKGLFDAGLLAALASCTLSSCARTTDPVSGSETHFLEACNMSCGSDLECVDGQCSAPCSDDTACLALNQSSTCGEQPSGLKACEVTCVDDDDCMEVRAELTCNAGVCRGPLWQLNVAPNPDASDEPDPTNDASADSTSEEVSSTSPVGSGATILCDGHPGCPPAQSMYFRLPEEGLGTLRIEFMLNLDDTLVRCTTEFVDDALVASLCESQAVAPAVLDETCSDSAGCMGSLRLDIQPKAFEVNYWRDNDYQTLILPSTSWTDTTFGVGPEGCNFSCTTAELNYQLPSLKSNACLSAESECTFGLGCGDRQSALANAPACDDDLRSVSTADGCGYDILVYQQYIEGELAFYDKETGAFVGFWHRSDTLSVECSGLVPANCTEGMDIFDVCETSDAGTNDAGASEANFE